MIVKGTVLINYEIKLENVDDISEDTMSLYESDRLIAKSIDSALPPNFNIEGEIRVNTTSDTP